MNGVRQVTQSELDQRTCGKCQSVVAWPEVETGVSIMWFCKTNWEPNF